MSDFREDDPFGHTIWPGHLAGMALERLPFARQEIDHVDSMSEVLRHLPPGSGCARNRVQALAAAGPPGPGSRANDPTARPGIRAIVRAGRVLRVQLARSDWWPHDRGGGHDDKVAGSGWRAPPAKCPPPDPPPGRDPERAHCRESRAGGPRRPGFQACLRHSGALHVGRRRAHPVRSTLGALLRHLS